MIVSIQYLRGLAAFLVVLLHLFPMFSSAQRNPFWFGAVGVDIFFVISGFIMWRITYERAPNPINFFISRLLRIGPPYWIATLVLASCALLKPNLFPLDNPEISHVLLSLAFVPHGSGEHGSPLLSQGWTLVFEMFFYVIFALSLFLAKNIRLFFVSAVLITLYLISFVSDPVSAFQRVIFSDLLLEFLLGIIIAVNFERLNRMGIKISSVAFCAGVTWILTNPLNSEIRLIFFGIPAALIAVSLISNENFFYRQKNAFFLMSGNISYSLYLVHFLAASLYKILAPHFGLPHSGIVAFSLAILTAIAAALFFHFAVEEPLRNACQMALKAIGQRRQPLRESAG